MHDVQLSTELQRKRVGNGCCSVTQEHVGDSGIEVQEYLTSEQQPKRKQRTIRDALAARSEIVDYPLKMLIYEAAAVVLTKHLDGECERI